MEPTLAWMVVAGEGRTILQIFNKNAEHLSIRSHRRYGEKVYGSITTQQGLAGWWTPGATASAEIDTIARFRFGPSYFKEMQITELRQNKEVRWTCLKGDAEWVGTNLSFKLLSGDKSTLLSAHPEIRGQVEQLEADNATLLIFRHDNWREDTPMFAECSYTWGQFLRSLKLFCETGKGRPWPLQHT